MEESYGIWKQISDMIPQSEYQEIVNSIGRKIIDDVQFLWREFLALEEIVGELEGADVRKQFKKVYIGEESDILQSIQSKLCIGKIDQVSEEVGMVIQAEQTRLEREISRCRRILDSGTDNVLQMSAENTPRSARSTASDASDAGTPRNGKGKARCLSCGDRLLTSESTIKVPGAVRIKISDPNIAFCSSCQLVYHLDSMEAREQEAKVSNKDLNDDAMMYSSKSQSSIKRIDCVRGLHVPPILRRASDDNGVLTHEASSSSSRTTYHEEKRGEVRKSLDSQRPRGGEERKKELERGTSISKGRDGHGWGEEKKEDEVSGLIKSDGSFGVFGTAAIEVSKAKSKNAISKFNKKIQNARDDHFLNDELL